MLTRITFEVPGLPVAQPRATTAADGHFYPSETGRAWKERVVLALRREYQGVRLPGPIAVCCIFRLPRPKVHYTKGDPSRRTLRSDAPTHHITKPDADNLLKTTMDALTRARLWRDDALVAGLWAWKRYVTLSENPGARIEIRVLGAQEMP